MVVMVMVMVMMIMVMMMVAMVMMMMMAVAMAMVMMVLVMMMVVVDVMMRIIMFFGITIMSTFIFLLWCVSFSSEQGLDHANKGLTLVSSVIKECLGIDVSVLMGANLAGELADEKFGETTIGKHCR